MGIFDRVLPSSNQELTPAEGFVGIAVCAVAADGVVTADEIQGLATSLTRARLFRESSPKQVEAAFGKVTRLARDQGVEHLLGRCAKAVPRELRPTAFAIAADLLFADGEVTGSERKYLERIQHALEVPEDLAVRLVEAMAIKNKA